MDESLSPKGKRVGAVSDRDKLLIYSAIPGRRISAEVNLPNCSRWIFFMLAGLIRWLEKLPDQSATLTHELKTKVVPALITGKLKSKDAIKFFC